MKVLSDIETQASVEIKDENADDYAIIKNADAGRRIWVQTADPAGSSANGDIWIQLP